MNETYYILGHNSVIKKIDSGTFKLLYEHEPENCVWARISNGKLEMESMREFADISKDVICCDVRSELWQYLGDIGFYRVNNEQNKELAEKMRMGERLHIAILQ
ncbi:MAG: hypothetical protein J6Q59_04150 [Paludibacteraceae bacterium]|nr:hypothetical protein [Paludibacteraceae bacterium]